MNFLVSNNPVLIDQYWAALLENGESQVLSDFPELLWRAATSNKGLILLDLKVNGFPGMSGITNLKRSNHSLKVLLLASELTTEEELSALAAGAAGCCGSNLLPEKIRQIFATVEDNGVWISSATLPHLLQRLKRLENLSRQNKSQQDNGAHRNEITGLTPREREIVNLVAKGDSNKIIARELNITDRTVKTHLSIIFQKLKVNDRLQLALLANKNWVA